MRKQMVEQSLEFDQDNVVEFVQTRIDAVRMYVPAYTAKSSTME